MTNYAIKGEEIIAITPENKNDLIWYEFRELTEEELILYEKQCLEHCWYIVEIIDGVCVKTDTDESKKYEVRLRYKRMLEINSELSTLWKTDLIIPDVWLEASIAAQVIRLNDEYTDIQAEISENYEGGLVGTVLDVLFI